MIIVSMCGFSFLDALSSAAIAMRDIATAVAVAVMRAAAGIRPVISWFRRSVYADPPIVAGMLMRNESLRAVCGLLPSASSARMVIPLRLIPGSADKP